MDDGRLRGDGRLGDDFSGNWAERGGEESREDWKSFRERVDREWRARRSGGAGESELAAEEPLRPSDNYAANDPDLHVPGSRERLFGGPSSELFGGVSGPLYTTGELAAYSASRDMSQGPNSEELAAALPQQAQNEYVDEQYEETQSSGLVRPYFRTRGRTRPTYDLAIEALVSTSEHGRLLDRVRVPEHRSICDLCLDTRSVAEVAALLRLPLGVVRVLIGDVAGLGLVLVHTSGAAVGDRPSIEFMERVLSGLRRI
ncbi:DUF742 domain-containing protein [Amycolatopsis sp. NPDC059021]|uniref:DUF742 domain-containing protein n=1 Tax=Amycolatopsis sp. NPDC059021 TaxID=3346704 RepID=UPI00367186CF